jgi:hypothetical protein
MSATVVLALIAGYVLIHLYMVRPNTRMLNQLQRQVSQNSVPYTVERLQESASDELGASASTQYKPVGQRELNIQSRRQVSSRDVAGQTADTYLDAVCTIDTDIEQTDRIQYDQRTFEVQARDKEPPVEPVIYSLTLEQV